MPTRERRAKVLSIPIEQLPDARGQHGNHVRGDQHHRWNDCRILSTHGYVKLRVGADHPLADPNGYAYEHLVVWVSAGREPPRFNDLLHHKNEDRTDNRLANLELKTRGDHSAHHLSDRGRDERGRFKPRVGKKSAGALLDGREHREWPDA